MRRFLHLLPLVVLSFTLAGCPSWFGDEEEEKKPFVLGDLIEPFDPPTLEELDAKVEWLDGEIVDPLERLRQRLHEEGDPPVALAEALNLGNNTVADNLNIRAAFGRLPSSDGQVNWNGSIVRHSAADVKSTNPILGSSTIEFDVSGLTSVGLMGFDWAFNPFAIKDTVVRWQSSKDMLYDKIVLRDDVTWSDGKPFTAHDVEFSFKVIMSEQVPVPAQRSGTDKLKWVKAYDDHTVVFFHKAPLATNVWNIAFSILPKHIYETSIYEDPTLQESDYHVKFEKNPVVGGAYEITSRDRDHHIELTSRESWYMHDGKQVRDKPYFRKVRFEIIVDTSIALLALKGGNIEEMILNPQQWKNQTNDDDFYKSNTKAFDVEWVYYYFGWNCKRPLFSDKRVRTAMSYAFDHDEMLETLRYGLDEPSNGIFHSTSRWAPKDPPKLYKQDLKKAEQLLDEAGWSDHDGDGYRDKEIDGKSVRFEFSILVMNKQERIAICNLLKENLEQIGIICNVRPLEFTVLQDKTRKHEFQAHFGGWGTGAYPDTGENLWRTDADRNFGQYSNPEVDRLFDEAMKELDDAKRREIFGRIHTTLYEDQPYTWLYFRNAYYGFNKNLRGWVFSPRGPYTYGPGFSSIWKPAAQ